MPPRVEPGGLDRGFGPAIEFFKGKVNLPTRTWQDLQHGQHARAFVVAGAMKEDLLADLRAAVDAAVAGGASYDTFKRRFKDIVARHGWEHTGSAAWRSRVIWHTNVRTAFAAGRYAQMTDPAVLEHMPFWQYDHTTLLNPREEHRTWDGLVLRWDDPWWDVHYPPNGWGCNCRVRPLSQRQLEKLGKAGPDAAPAAGAGEVRPEWRYNVGQAAHGLPPQRQAMREVGDGRWEDMPHLGYGNWEAAGLPDVLPVRPLATEPLRDVATADALQARLTQLWGGQARRQFTVQGRNGFEYPLVADAEVLARHLSEDKRPFAGHIDDVLGDPDEVWLAFMRSRESGKVALRVRALRTIKVGSRVLLAVMEASRGELVAWTLFPKDGTRAINRLRQGHLLYAPEPQK